MTLFNLLFLTLAAAVAAVLLFAAYLRLRFPAHLRSIIMSTISRLSGGKSARKDRLRHIDTQTGLLSREAFVNLAGQDTPDRVLILCDIDHFKHVNAKWGHVAGNNVLGALSELFRQTGQPAARMGGQEFAILLRNATESQARMVAQGLRTAFSHQCFDGLPADERLTASFGIAVSEAGEGFDRLFCRADRALYAAKDAGRDQVVVAFSRRTVIDAA